MPQLCGGMTGEQQPPVFSSSTGGRDGRDRLGPSCPGGDDAGWHGCLLNLFLRFLLLYWDIVLIYPYNDLFAGKTDTPFSFWRGLMESRFNYYIFFFFFGCVSLSGDMSCVRVDRSQPITVFCCSVRPMFSVMCGLSCSLFMVVGCSHFYVVFVFYSRHLYFYLFYIISKGIFHIGGLVSKMHISVYVLFTEWKCFCFFSFIEYNLGIMNIQCIL